MPHLNLENNCHLLILLSKTSHSNLKNFVSARLTLVMKRLPQKRSVIEIGFFLYCPLLQRTNFGLLSAKYFRKRTDHAFYCCCKNKFTIDYFTANLQTKLSLNHFRWEHLENMSALWTSQIWQFTKHVSLKCCRAGKRPLMYIQMNYYQIMYSLQQYNYHTAKQKLQYKSVYYLNLTTEDKK